ncbi:DUF4332 domain-containing protein [Anatilimnocola floriformis]|uniref:DUF4332 domain-containing protein n=1 Tax=Anatilimnocola floriformis TaxID=2948575 RepID=UPI0020C2EAB4|nr:DUF4332 domain-containing protein [Anatilimnocola floriformis]
MSLLFTVVFASGARSTHHKLALDALRHLRMADAQSWMDVFLRYNASYLDGAKAPDTQFKDFKNHVLHVRENYWGGAVAAAEKWYAKSLQALKTHDWEDAVYSIGVMSHYFSDPLMPLHTGQSEDEGPIHRAVEWSVCKSYGELQHILDEDQGGYPRWECPTGSDWLAQMVRRAADLSNPHYETIIDHYDLAAGTRDPLLGLDQTLKDVFAKCLGYAVIGLARIIEKLIEEANVDPPWVDVTLQGVMAAAKMPFRAIAKNIEDVHEREKLRQIFDEFERTGKVIETLSPDDAEVRKAHAAEVLHTPLSVLDSQPIRKPGERHGQGVAVRERSARSVTVPVIDNRKRSTNVPQPEPAPAEPKFASATKLPFTPAAKTPPKESVKEPVKEVAKQVVKESPKEKLLRYDAPTEIEEPIKAVAPPPPATPKKPEPVAVVKEPVKEPAKEPVKEKHAAPKAIEKPAEKPPEKPPAKAAEKLRVDPPAEEKPAPKKTEKKPAETKLKFYLDRSKPIQDAPSIGSKTADRMRAAGVNTVGELLSSHPEKLAAKLDVAHIVADVIRQWQAEATLVCRVPGLRGHDAQILVACGIDQPAELAESEVEDLLELITPFVESSDGQRVLRGSEPPDEEEVSEWIAAAGQARSLKAA